MDMTVCLLFRFDNNRIIKMFPFSKECKKSFHINLLLLKLKK